MVGLGVGFLLRSRPAPIVVRPSTRLPIAKVSTATTSDEIEIEGFAWPASGLYPTLSGRSAVYLEFRLEREVAAELGSRWETVFERISSDSFYVVDASGATMVHPEEALLDVEEWTTVNWRQLETEQKDRLINGLLEGAQIPEFPPGEFTVTGPLQPRFQIYEKAIYIGSPLQIAGRFKSLSTGPRGLEAPELESFLAKVKTPEGRLTNLEAIVAAHYGSQITVRQAREESVLLAEETAMNPGPALPSQTALYGDFENDPNRRLVITDLHESAVGLNPPSRPNRLLPVAASLLFIGLVLGASDNHARSQYLSALGLAPELSVSQHASVRPIAKKSKHAPKNPPVEAALNSTPTLSGGVRLSAAEIEKSQSLPGANRWAVSMNDSVVVLRPPQLKPELVIPAVSPLAGPSALHEKRTPEVIANRWLGSLHSRDENGVSTYAVWDLDKARIASKHFQKNLVAAALLGPQAESVATFSESADLGLTYKIIEAATGKVLHEQTLKGATFKKLAVAPLHDRFVLVVQDANQTPVAYQLSGLKPNAPLALQPVGIGLLKGLDQKVLFSEDGSWLAVSRSESVIVTSTLDWKMKFNFQIPGSTPQTHLEPLAFTKDDRLILLQDGTKLFVYSTLSVKPSLSQLMPFEVGAELLAISRDGLTALLRNQAKDRLLVRPLIEPAKQKQICKADCYKSQLLGPVEVNPDFSWVHVPVASKEISLWDLKNERAYVPEYDLRKSLAIWNGSPPAGLATECLTFTTGCLAAGQKAVQMKDYARAYGYFYGACRAGAFDACVEIVKAAPSMSLTAQQAASFADFGCRFGHASSCAAREPAAAPPAAPPTAPSARP